ncbi:hypothetical protein IMZ48_12475 [Candidatus Bathyarchaeota archaeon]|nr:hypothetical protein [Candidatus Bathyarchaeota archaeon]
MEDLDPINYAKPRSRSSGSKQAEASNPATIPAKRSATDISPKKPTGSRKPSSRTASAGQRPKTRSGGPNKDASRPSTRSGEFTIGSTSSKQPEGDPPWLMSSYRPDPRLPPDQQLLPTVARRLQQERWEKEGKFGNVLDKEFRPLNNEGFTQPPEKQDVQPEPKSPTADDAHAYEWPLREEPPRSYTPKPPSVYSVMPKIQDKASPASPPSIPMGPEMQRRPTSPGFTRVPEQEQEQEKKGGGCGCCIVM